MTRFRRHCIWFATAITLCVLVHAGCGNGIPSLKQSPAFSKNLRSDLNATSPSEARSQHSGEWLTSWELAQSESIRTGKPIMALFTGSDWCGPCIALKTRVLKTNQFVQWAKDNVVLLELDFPRNKSQSPEIKAQNRELSEKYNIAGYPTVLIIDADGQVKGKLGHSTNVNSWLKRAASVIGS